MSDEVLSALRLYGKLSWSYHSETKEHAAAFAQVVRHVKAYADAKVSTKVVICPSCSKSASGLVKE